MNEEEARQWVADNLEEKNYSEDPDPTFWGVLQVEYNDYLKELGRPPMDVRLMTVEDLQAIYVKNYWGPCRCDELPADLALVVFQAALNIGQVTAVKLLQRVVSVKPDGEFGPLTMEAVRCGEALFNIVRMFLLFQVIYYYFRANVNPTGEAAKDLSGLLNRVALTAEKINITVGLNWNGKIV